MGGSKNTVSLTLAGDEKSLSRAVKAGASDVDSFAKDVGQASDKAVAALKGVDKAAQGIQPAEIKIDSNVIPAQKKLKDLEQEGQNLKPAKLKASVDSDGIAEGLRKAGDVGADAFSGSFLGALAGGGIVAGISEMISSGIDAMSDQKNLIADIGNNMGITPQAAAAYGKRIGTAYGDGLGESKGQIAEVYATLSSDVKDWAKLTEGSQDKIARNQVKIMDAFQVSSQESIAAASSAVTNKLVPTWQDAQDLLVTGYQILGSRGDDWAETLQEYSGYFAQLGINGSQALGLIQQGLQAGARDTDYVADVWKEVGIRIIDSSKSTKDALKDLFKGTKTDVEALQKTIAAGGPPAEAALEKVITRLQGMKDPLQKQTIGVALFGTQYEDTFKRVIEQTDLAKAKMTEYSGATDKLVQHQRTLTDQIGQMWTALNVRAGGAVEDIKTNVGNGDWITPATSNIDLFADATDNAAHSAYTYGISLDGTTRGIDNLAASIGGYGSPAFVDLIKKMSDSELRALGVDRTMNDLGQTVLAMPNGKPIIIDNNLGKVVSDLGEAKRRVDNLPNGSKWFNYYINTVVTGPGTGSLNSLNAVLGGGHAYGGWISGPGTATSDSILTPMSKGEYAVQAKVASRNGRELERLDSGMSWADAGGYRPAPVPVQGGWGGGPVAAQLSIGRGADSLLGSVIMNLLRTNQIQLSVAPRG